MKKFFGIAAIAALSFVATAAQSAPVIDGQYDASYGAASAHVNYDPAAPTSNFGTPGNTNHTTAYDIYLTSDASYVYALLRASTVTGLQFANLYFDLDPANNNGSDLGFEVTNDRAFIPGVGGYSAPLGLTFALSGDGLGVEVAFANSLFTAPIAGLSYAGGQQFPSVGDSIVLRLSQSFGYSVAGGPTYGTNRLGAVAIGGAVPEAPTWAMMLAGFGAIGFVLRRSQTAARVQFA